MALNEGYCSYCNAVNSYDDTRCKACGQDLPWAQWVVSRTQSSSAIGAEAGSFAGATGRDVKDGLAFLPPGAFTKIFLVVAALVVFYLILNFVTPTLHQATRGAAGNGVSPVPTGGIVEQFKKANPALQQDAEERREERKETQP